MEFVINYTYREIRRTEDNAHLKSMDEVMDAMIDMYEYWSHDDDVSLFVYETASDDEFSYVTDLITKYEYRISKIDSAFFLFEDDQAEMSAQYDIWIKTQEGCAPKYDDCWNGWDEPWATCDI